MSSKNWTRENLAYLGGLLEGEGSFLYYAKENRIRVQLQMTDEDVVKRAHEIAGSGSFLGPYQPKPSGNTIRKPVWMLQVHGSNAYALMVAVYPWMGYRRRLKIREVITKWSENWRPVIRDEKGRFALGCLAVT